MRSASDTQLVIDLAELFATNKVHTQSVTYALECICKHFPFDCGLIYELNQENIFQLKEFSIQCNIHPQNTFEAHQIASELRHRIASEPCICLNREQNNDATTLEFLNIFFAQSLALVAILDEDSQPYGILVFTNVKQHGARTQAQDKMLPMVMHMLAKYLGLRVYANKFAFAQNSLSKILDNTGIDIYVNDFHTHEILYANKPMAEPYGGVSQFLGHKCWKVLFPAQNEPCEFCPQKKLLDEEGNPTKMHSWDYQRPFDGSWFRVFSTAFRWIDGRIAHVVSSANITDNKRNEAMIEYLANYDSLTNLPNRRMLVAECERSITNATEDERGYLLFFDIDGFKNINDTYGHDAGDEFLVKLGEFFSAIPMLKDSIYRNGGDEFIALIGGKTVTIQHVRNLVGFILARFKKPWELKKGSIYCNTSVGIGCYPNDACTAEELLAKADQAMYTVKKAGGGGMLFAYELVQDTSGNTV